MMRNENLEGQIFGRLTVQNYEGKKNKRTQWKCICSCGNFITTSADRLKRQHTKSCGCARTGRLMSPRLNLIGKKFSRLLVLSRDKKDNNGHYLWNCICDCGNNIIIRANSLQSKNSVSCGCLRKELVGALQRTHGKSSTREYAVWRSMRRRCNNPKDAYYKDYGGRGIKVCDQWKTFVQFLNDMGERPSNRHSIERVNNDKGYEPNNCIWATRSQQVKNRRPIKALGNFSDSDIIKEFKRRGLINDEN